MNPFDILACIIISLNTIQHPEKTVNLDTVNYLHDGAVAIIKLNRPQAGNALSAQLATDLLAAASTARDDETVRAVVFSAEGNVFSFGGDLKEFKAFGGQPEKLKPIADELHHALAVFLTMPKPVIVAINGMAAGAGVPMSLVGDIVIVDETARFRLAYTAAGLSPDGGSTWLLPRLIGIRRTQELIFENRELSAQEAVEWGLATRTVAEGTAVDAAIELAQVMASGPTMAFASTRKMLQTTFANDFIAQTDIETQEIAANMAGHDGSEGIDAFVNKRKPEFKGMR